MENPEKVQAVLEKIANAKEALAYFDGRILDGEGNFEDRATATYRLHSAIVELEAAAMVHKQT